MEYTLADVAALFRTPVGRTKLFSVALNRSAPILNLISGIYRRTLIRSVKVIAVTGSFGKTTTARAIVTALGGIPHRHIGWNTKAFLALSVLRVRRRQRQATLEVGVTGPGQMAGNARLVKPDIVVVTSIGSEHSRSFATLEATRSEKADLLRTLPVSGVVFVNGDDPHVRWMAAQTPARVVTYGFGPECDVRASRYALDWPHGARCDVQTTSGAAQLHVRLLGRHLIYPILAAIAVGLHEGLPLERLATRLESLNPTPARLDLVRLANGAIVLRDYFKSAAETMEAAAEVFTGIPARRKIAVLGEVNEPMGPSRQIYRGLGESFGRAASQMILLTGENFSSFVAGAKLQGSDRHTMTHAKTVGQAVSALPADLGAGDVVLIKGRSSQRLERVLLALQGRTVRCDLTYCNARLMQCDVCPMLERGWQGLRPIV